MARKFIPNLLTYDHVISHFEGNEFVRGEDPEAIAFNLEEIYPNGGVEINSYGRNGGGSNFYMHIEDILRLVAYCTKYNIHTFFVRNNYDQLDEF